MKATFYLYWSISDKSGVIFNTVMEFPFIKTILKGLPSSIVDRISPQIAQFRRVSKEPQAIFPVKRTNAYCLEKQ